MAAAACKASGLARVGAAAPRSPVREVLRNHLHYNLDFPTFSFRVPKFDPRDVPHILHRLAQVPLIRRIADVSTPTSIAFGVPRFSALLDRHNWNVLRSPTVRFRQYGKLRFKVLPQTGELRLTPVLQLLSKSPAWPTVVFDNSEVLGLWQQLLPPAEPADPSTIGTLQARDGVEDCVRGRLVPANCGRACGHALRLRAIACLGRHPSRIGRGKRRTSCQRLWSRKRWTPWYAQT